MTSPTQPNEELLLEDRHADLEMMYVREYFQDKGLSLEDVQKLPAEEAKALWREALLYASGRLADAESRSQMLHELEGKERPL